jgi:CheY-like chemotaxis protein
LGLVDGDGATLTLLAFAVRRTPIQAQVRRSSRIYGARPPRAYGVHPVSGLKAASHTLGPRRRVGMTSTKRVLVVDDDRDIRCAVAEALVQEGYAVETASNGLQALNVASRVSLDAIVLDLMMPVMDGWSFLARCRTRPWCHEVPIVAMSAAYAPRAAGERLRELGVRVVVTKPFDLESLIGTVQAYAPLARP